MIKKIISGFQTGADIGAIKAAKDAGVETGGWMPKGWKTLDGPRPAYADLYGAKEHSSSNYAERTWDNILEAHGTIRIATNFSSPGEKCTLNGIKNHNKPHHDIDLSIYPWPDRKVYIRSYLYAFILKVHCLNPGKFEWESELIINVAGNAEKTSPGIEKTVYEIITDLIKVDRWYNELD